MKLSDIFNRDFECECGVRHHAGVAKMVYQRNALEDLPGLIAEKPSWRRAVLFADTRTFDVAGARCLDILRAAGLNVEKRIVPDSVHGDPVCDDITKNAIVSESDLSSDFFIAAGSGVVSDIVKWVSSETDVPYIAVATAASMNGYTSNNIAPAIKGVKRVIDGTTPVYVVSEPEIIKNAPFRLTASGLGDVLAKPVSTADWKLNNLLFGDYYCEFCARLIHELEPSYMTRPELIALKDDDAVEALFMALLYSGLSMTMAGTSSPASGGEHMISHALDMTALAGNMRHDYHGRQVGLGVIFASALYERILALEKPVFRFVEDKLDGKYWTSIAGVVEEQHVLKLGKAAAAVETLENSPSLWDNIRAALSPMTRSAALIKDCLRKAGAANTVGDIGCDKERFMAAALHCHQMRERYTVVDLARATGILPEAAGEIIEEYL